MTVSLSAGSPVDPSNGQPAIIELPEDVLKKIFSLLRPLTAACCVSVLWNNLAVAVEWERKLTRINTRHDLMSKMAQGLQILPENESIKASLTDFFKTLEFIGIKKSQKFRHFLNAKTYIVKLWNQ